MRSIFYLFVGLLLSVIMVLGCSEDPIQLEDNILNNNTQGTLKDTTLYPIIDTTFAGKTEVSTRFSNAMLLGSFDGVETRPIFTFTDLFGIPDTAIFQSAKVRLISTGIIGGANKQPFQVTAFPVINKTPDNLDSAWNNFRNNIDQTVPLSDPVTITPDTTDTLTFDLNANGLDRVKFWSDTANLDQNNGMILDFQSSNFIKGFSTSNVSVFPAIILEYTFPNDDTVNHDTLTANLDAYIYQGEIPNPPNSSPPNKENKLNFTSTLIIYRTLLKFDLEGFWAQFPQGVVINSANLQMPVDRGNSLLPSDFSPVLNILPLTGNIKNKDSVEVDTNAVGQILLNQWNEDSTQLDIAANTDRQQLAQQIIQDQLRNLDSPHGLSVEFRSKSNFYAYIAFYDRKQKLTRLNLTYWIPPKPRF